LNGNAFCGANACGPRDQLLIDGTCTRCNDYEKVSENGRNCIPVTSCPTRFEVVELDGRCRQCLNGFVSDMSGRRCIEPNCGPGYSFNRDQASCVKDQVPKDGRRKQISLVSISPLDRLLNQATERDEIIVRVGCTKYDRTDPVFLNDASDLQLDDFDFDFEVDSVNRIHCPARSGKE
jgi:hypothetical protein